MRWNKKGFSFKMLNMALYRLMFVTIIFFILFMFTASIIKTNFDTSNIRDLLTLSRLIYSPSSISYTDDYTGRVYPGLIDIEKLNDDTLVRAFNYTENKVAMRLELTNLETDSVSEAYLNKAWYERWEPLSKFEQYDKDIKFRYVLITDEGKIYKGLLRIDMVVVNE